MGVTSWSSGERRERMEELRRQLLRVQGARCAMPACSEPWVDVAHIAGSGMGGRPSTYNLANVAGLCRSCHDTFDGRQMAGRQELLRRLLAAYTQEVRRHRRAVGVVDDA